MDQVANSSTNTVAAPVPPVIGSYLSPAGKLKNRWLYHVLFWVLYILFVELMFFSLYRIPDYGFYVLILLFFPLEMVLVYFNFYVLMPRLLFARKYLLYGLSIFAGVLLVAIVNILIHYWYASLGFMAFTIGANFDLLSLIGRVLEMIYLMGFTSGIKMASNWMLHLQWIKEKEKQFLETELNFLKSQIQPHFFFNTLNNLYSLTLKKSDQAPEVVLKLSDLMSYMLYESGSGRVALEKEIAYLQNYIDVEKLRFGQRLEVFFETPGNTENVFIPPMVLILFVENSFKHGVKNNVHHITISISLKLENGFLFFRVTNPQSTAEPAYAKACATAKAGGDTRSADKHEGIGLKNVRRRLDLLFGKNYTLKTEEKDKQFIVSLKMPVW